MKKRICLLACAVLLALCACGRPILQEAAETPAPAAVTVPAPEAADDLTPVLTEIRERMHPGTAGSSLTARLLAARFLDWSTETEMEEEQIRAAVEDFRAPMSEEERRDFALQLLAVDGARGLLLSENSRELMEEIGGAEGTNWPWTDAPTEKLDAVLAAAQAEELTAGLAF